MGKSLIYLNEDLASSIALRFAAQIVKQTGMKLQTIHVEEFENEEQAGTGWVRRTWEQGLIAAGRDSVQRLLKTEKVDCPFAGEAKVVVGDPETEIMEEFRHGIYELYIEGYLNTTHTKDFHDLLATRRLREMNCPILIVKNLVPSDRVLLLLSEAVDARQLIEDFTRLYSQAPARPPIEITVLYYRFMETPALRFLDNGDSGSPIHDTEKLLKEKGWGEPEIVVVQGTPEQAAHYLRDYGLVVSSFPTRTSPRAELIALIPNPVLLFKQAVRPEKE